MTPYGFSQYWGYKRKSVRAQFYLNISRI
jgi:hypothetical protein